MEPEVQEIITAARGERASTLDRLFATLYGELHRLAEQNLHRGGGNLTIGATTLLHEAYLDIARREGLAFPDQSRFLAYASRAMRGLVIDHVRRRRARKRDRAKEVTLDGRDAPADPDERRVEALEQLGDALELLAQREPALAELVDLHFFCGFSFVEIAGLRGSSERTVQREWRKARLMLHRTLIGDAEPAAADRDADEAPGPDSGPAEHGHA